MSDIFLSYKKEEKAIAKIYAGALELKGFSVWWDPDIDHGDIFDKVIQKQLDIAKCVMVLWSKKSVESDWVRSEATYGKSRLVSVLIEDVKIPVPFNLIQTANLTGWKGDQTDPEFLRLLESVSKKLGRSNTSTAEIPKRTEIGSYRNEIEKILDKYSNSIGMKFRLIPAGEFMMGSKEYEWEEPVHKVTINKPFFLGIYPVTQKQWMILMDQNPSYFLGDQLPVENVSWNDVMEFINKLNILERTTNYYLPSEAEWEYAARAGTTTRFFFGDDESKMGDYAWYSGNSEGKAKPVGTKKPNSWGLYDMLGNVWEWVEDNEHENYEGAPGDGSTWICRDCFKRINRGGSWDTRSISCRSASRTDDEANIGANTRGFRIMKVK